MPSLPAVLRAIVRAFLILVLVEVSLQYFGAERPPWQPVPFKALSPSGLEHPARGSVVGRLQGVGVRDTWLRQKYVAVRAERGAFRIVVCGSSAIYGYGVPLARAAPWQLERALQRTLPGQRWEVINLGQQGSGSSIHALNVRDALSELRPDLMIVMVGNNEYLPLMGYRSRFPDYDSRPDLEGGFTRGSRLYSLLCGLVDWILPPPRVDNATQARRIGLEQLRDGDQALVETVYARNLTDMCDACRTADVPLVLCTVPVNRCWPPFAFNVQISPLPAAVYRELEYARGLKRQGRAAEALTHIGALEQHFENPYLRYERGMCLLLLGRADEAKRALDETLMLDRHPRRADPRFAGIVRRVGQQWEVPVCDLAAGLDALAPNGVPADEDFLDACHLTPTCLAKIARMWVEFLCANRLLPTTGGLHQTGEKGEGDGDSESLERWPGHRVYFKQRQLPPDIVALDEATPGKLMSAYLSNDLPRLVVAQCTSARLLRIYGHILATDDRVDDALACYLRSIALTLAPRPAQYFEAGLMAMLGGRFAVAQSLFQRGDPSDPTLQRLLHLVTRMEGLETVKNPLPTTVPTSTGS